MGVHRGRLCPSLRGLLDGVHGRTEGRQPGGARGVAGPGGAAEAQGVGEALAGDGDGLAGLPLHAPGRVVVLSLVHPHQDLVPPLSAAVTQVHQNWLPIQMFLSPACTPKGLIADFQCLVVTRLHQTCLVFCVAKEGVVEAHDLRIIAQASVVVVTILEGDQVTVALLSEVQVSVKACVRDIDVSVRSRKVHRASLLQVPDATAREARSCHHVGARALWHQWPDGDAQRLGQVFCVCDNVSQGDLRRRLHEPGLERQVLACGLEAEGHEIRAED
mmetsp:Transcript_53806/g.129613  ORF Transcript_53806/g.129613 Transcript_53806/m.129613 type:complete len:274 (+) Transcript_53806:1382-2203(+)